METEEWYFAFGFIYCDKNGAGEVVRTEIKLKARSKDDAIAEAKEIRDSYVAQAKAEMEGESKHPKHGKAEYVDKNPVFPTVVCRIKL